MKRIAFLGMGVMGKYMAGNLARSARFEEVTIWNRNPVSEGIRHAALQGATSRLTIIEAVKDADCVCLCLSNAQAVRQVLFDEDGAARFLKPGAILLDFSTIDTLACREISDQLNSYGVKYYDLPVSGGDVGAMNGTLTIMIGGTPAEMEQAEPVLSLLGTNKIYCGGIGNGQLLKAINQVLCAINTLAVCEALSLADIQKIPLRTVVEACSTGAAGSWALSHLGARICEENYNSGFQIKHMLKDLDIAKKLLPEHLKLAGMDVAINAYSKALATDETGEIATQGLFNIYRNQEKAEAIN